MPVIIDTCIWSLALRRRPGSLSVADRKYVTRWREIVHAGEALFPGVVRQELLSGIHEVEPFDNLCAYLRAFDDAVLDPGDYEQAARCANLCKSGGIAFSAVDMTLCGLAVRNDLQILTLDRDFDTYGRVMPLRLIKC